LEFDLPTLIAVEAFIAAISAAVILAACLHGRDGRGCVWWALGSIVTALALMLVLFGEIRGSDGFVAYAYAVFALSPALYWTGARVFAGRAPLYPLILVGAVLKFLLAVVPPFRISAEWQLELSLAIAAVYLAAGAVELLRSREKVTARWFLIVVLAAHSAFFAAGGLEALSIGPEPVHTVSLFSWFGLVHFHTILFSMVSAAFVIAFVRERSEAHQRRLAEVDLVTGVATRRAFIGAMTEATERSRPGGPPVSVAVFDLDQFKAINDAHGHAMGDKVLKLFGETVRGVSRRGDRVGRLGGEEFALLLPETSLPAALEIAERVRLMFEAVGRTVEGVAINATVSAGVATATRDSTVQSLLIAADAGLYQAKAQGRNRVERAPGRPGPLPLRVA
jgi:diguanylate cyclase (GGDEF)-like protein